MKQLGIFAKYWQAGEVKTRLAKSIGEQRAARLYRTFVETLLRRLATTGDRRVLAFTPSDRQDEFTRLRAELRLADDWRLERQTEGDLGARMQHFFSEAFHGGAKRVALLGSDSPNLPKSFVERAFALLDDAPIVLGPTYDGGYYLVAARDDALVGDPRGLAVIFEGITWSTDSVLRETTERLDSVGCRYQVLPRWYDVDDDGDLACLASDLAVEVDDDSLAPLRRGLVAALGDSDAPD